MLFTIIAFACLQLFLSKGDDVGLPLVEFCTSKGNFIVEVHPEWAPIGAKHFLQLVEDGFYTDIAFYRSVNRFLTQFGISENPEKKHWHREQIKDDIPSSSHRRIDKHMLSYAGGGPNTRSTQLFIAYEFLDFLGKEPWEIPFGRVIEGNDVVDTLYKGYGDIPPFGNGPNQQILFNQGNDYIKENFPLTDFIYHCKILNQEVADTILYPEIVVKYLRSNMEVIPEKEPKVVDLPKSKGRLKPKTTVEKVQKPIQNDNEPKAIVEKSKASTPIRHIDGSLYRWEDITHHAKSKYFETVEHPFENHEMIAILLACVAMLGFVVYYLCTCRKIASKNQ